jgi:hypothetical protein
MYMNSEEGKRLRQDGQTGGIRAVRGKKPFAKCLCHSDARQVFGKSLLCREPLTQWLYRSDARQVYDLPGAGFIGLSVYDRKRVADPEPKKRSLSKSRRLATHRHSRAMGEVECKHNLANELRREHNDYGPFAESRGAYHDFFTVAQVEGRLDLRAVIHAGFACCDTPAG